MPYRFLPGLEPTLPDAKEQALLFQAQFLHMDRIRGLAMQMFAPKIYEPFSREEFKRRLKGPFPGGIPESVASWICQLRHYLPLITNPVDLDDGRGADQTMLWRAFLRLQSFAQELPGTETIALDDSSPTFTHRENLMDALRDTGEDGYGPNRAHFTARLLHFRELFTAVDIESDNALIVRSQTNNKEYGIASGELGWISTSTRMKQLCAAEATLYRSSNKLWYDNMEKG